MDSVIEMIRQAHDGKSKRQADDNITETVIDGCQVKMRFNSTGDNKIITAIQSMLL